MIRQTLLGSVALMLSFSAIADYTESCEHEKQLDLTLNAASAESLRLDLGSGNLVIRGNDRLSEIRATGRACASSESLLEELRLEGTGGDRPVIKAHDPDSGWSLGKRYARIDLEVELPAGMAVDIDDGSGNIEVRQVAAVYIDDGSGGIDVTDIEGEVKIEDGSGSIRVAGTRGAVIIDDGSGNIDLEGVDSVRIEEDGSGAIRIADVVNDVRIDEDGSGEIRIRDVGGSVLIEDDSSGSIDVKSVAGDFSVARDGSGGIQYSQVDGEVRIPRDQRRK